MDRLGAAYTLEFSSNDVQNIAQYEEWSELFLRLRRLVNTYYETLGPEEEPVITLNEWMSRIACDEDCQVHPWLRSEWALHLLYTTLRRKWIRRR